jgi:hypothetical protein
MNIVIVYLRRLKYESWIPNINNLINPGRKEGMLKILEIRNP